MKKRTKNVQLSSMVGPKALTLVERPANQVAFRVVRSDNGEEVATSVRRVRRQRAESRSAFLSISFPAGTSREVVEGEAKQFGIEGHEIYEEGGVFVIRRSDTEHGDAPIMTVNIGDGRVVSMLRTDEPPSAARQDGLKLISIALDKEVFRSDEAAAAYLDQKAIDIAGWATENTATHYEYTREDVVVDSGEGKIEIEDGVVVQVARASEDDLPDSMYVVVSEAAYGSWGWGHLDFASALADVEFSNLTEAAASRFYGVVEQIMLHSRLPLAVRKELIYRAAAHYAMYLGNLLDGLPAGVVLVARSSNPKEEPDMAQIDDKNTETTATASAVENEQVATGASVDTVSRADVQAMIDSAVAAALAATSATTETAATTEVQRADESAADPKEAATLTLLQTLTRSVESLNASVAAVSERVVGIETTTLVRSDGNDHPTTTPTEAAKGSVFDGILTRNFNS